MVRLRLLETTGPSKIGPPRRITCKGQPALDSKPQEPNEETQPINITIQGNNKRGRGRNDVRNAGPVYLRKSIPQTASPSGLLELN